MQLFRRKEQPRSSSPKAFIFDPAKFVAVVTSICFLYSSVLSQGLYALAEDRRDEVNTGIPSESTLIPGSIGKVTESAYFGGNKVVINIQDLHCHPEVQRNISKIIENLDKKYELDRVYVEGGYGAIDTSWLCNIDDKELKQEIVENLMEQGKLTGGEYYSVFAGRPDLLKGIEDEALHKANIVRLGKILEQKGRFEQQLKKLDKDMAFLRAKFLGKGNKALDTLVARHRAGKIKSDKYYCSLEKLAIEANKDPRSYNGIAAISFDDYPNLRAYLDSSRQYRPSDYRKISRQTQDLLQFLRDRIPYTEYSLLQERTGNFSDSNELYSQLARLKLSPELDLQCRKSFPEAYAFFDYIAKQNALNNVRLVSEEKELVNKLRLSFSRNKSEIDISFIADFYPLYQDYLLTKLSADDYEYFKSRFAKFKQLWASYAYKDRISELSSEYALLDDYYRVNSERNTCFLDKIGIRSGGNTAQGTPSRINVTVPENADISVVITGGFHSEGLKKLLSDRNISYLVITPSVTKDTKSAELSYAEQAEYQAQLLSSSLALGLASQLTAPALFELALKAANKQLDGLNFTQQNFDELIQELEKTIGGEALIEKKFFNRRSGKAFIEFKNGRRIDLSITDNGTFKADSLRKEVEMAYDYFSPVVRESIAEVVKVERLTAYIVQGRSHELLTELFRLAAENNFITGNGYIFDLDESQDNSAKIMGIERELVARFPIAFQQILCDEDSKYRTYDANEKLKVLFAIDLLHGLLLSPVIKQEGTENNPAPAPTKIISPGFIGIKAGLGENKQKVQDMLDHLATQVMGIKADDIKDFLTKLDKKDTRDTDIEIWSDRIILRDTRYPLMMVEIKEPYDTPDNERKIELFFRNRAEHSNENQPGTITKEELKKLTDEMDDYLLNAQSHVDNDTLTRFKDTIAKEGKINVNELSEMEAIAWEQMRYAKSIQPLKVAYEKQKNALLALTGVDPLPQEQVDKFFITAAQLWMFSGLRTRPKFREYFERNLFRVQKKSNDKAWSMGISGSAALQALREAPIEKTDVVLELFTGGGDFTTFLSICCPQQLISLDLNTEYASVETFRGFVNLLSRILPQERLPGLTHPVFLMGNATLPYDMVTEESVNKIFSHPPYGRADAGNMPEEQGFYIFMKTFEHGYQVLKDGGEIASVVPECWYGVMKKFVDMASTREHSPEEYFEAFKSEVNEHSKYHKERLKKPFEPIYNAGDWLEIKGIAETFLTSYYIRSRHVDDAYFMNLSTIVGIKRDKKVGKLLLQGARLLNTNEELSETQKKTLEKNVRDLIANGDMEAYEKIKKVFRTSSSIQEDLSEFINDGTIYRAFPHLQLLNDWAVKNNHTLDQVKALSYLYEGPEKYAKFNEIGTRSPGPIKPETLTKYTALLKNLLEPKGASAGDIENNREFLFLVSLNHDLGDIIDQGHHQAVSADLISAVLSKYLSSIKDKDLKKAKVFLNSHGDIGAIYTGQKTPASLRFDLEAYSPDRSEQEELVNMLIAFSLADMQAKRGGEFLDNFFAEKFLELPTIAFGDKSDADFITSRKRIERLSTEYLSETYTALAVEDLEKQLKVLNDQDNGQIDKQSKERLNERRTRIENRIEDLKRYQDKRQRIMELYEKLPPETRQLIEKELPNIMLLNYSKSLLRNINGEEMPGKRPDMRSGNPENVLKLLVLTAFLAQEKHKNQVEYQYPHNTRWNYFQKLDESLSTITIPLEKFDINCLKDNYTGNAIFGIPVTESKESIIIDISSPFKMKNDVIASERQKTLILHIARSAWMGGPLSQFSGKDTLTNLWFTDLPEGMPVTETRKLISIDFNASLPGTSHVVPTLAGMKDGSLVIYFDFKKAGIQKADQDQALRQCAAQVAARLTGTDREEADSRVSSLVKKLFGKSSASRQDNLEPLLVIDHTGDPEKAKRAFADEFIYKPRFIDMKTLKKDESGEIAVAASKLTRRHRAAATTMGENKLLELDITKFEEFIKILNVFNSVGNGQMLVRWEIFEAALKQGLIDEAKLRTLLQKASECGVRIHCSTPEKAKREGELLSLGFASVIDTNKVLKKALNQLTGDHFPEDTILDITIPSNMSIAQVREAFSKLYLARTMIFHSRDCEQLLETQDILDRDGMCSLFNVLVGFGLVEITTPEKAKRLGYNWAVADLPQLLPGDIGRKQINSLCRGEITNIPFGSAIYDQAQAFKNDELRTEFLTAIAERMLISDHLLQIQVDKKAGRIGRDYEEGKFRIRNQQLEEALGLVERLKVSMPEEMKKDDEVEADGVIRAVSGIASTPAIIQSMVNDLKDGTASSGTLTALERILLNNIVSDYNIHRNQKGKPGTIDPKDVALILKAA